MRAKNLDDLYGTPGVEWAAVEARLNQGPTSPLAEDGRPNTTWLATMNPDGTPHVTGVGAMWIDGAYWFTSGDRTKKSKNLARDARCTITVALRDMDVSLEGEAHKVTDRTDVATVAEAFNAVGWPATVDETAIALTAPYSAPSAGPPPWYVYRVTAKSATVLLGAEPGGATRFIF